jgi:cytochrome c-type biogenesis protein CcmE
MKDYRFIVGPLVIVAAMVMLVASGLRSNTLRSIPVGELRRQDNTPQSLVGQRLRVVGFVGPEPVRQVPVQTPQGVVNVNHFTVMADSTGPQSKIKLAVEYGDALPDTFKANGPVQVDGLYSSAGVMRADNVLTKCPSKYQAENNADKVTR